MCVCMYVLVCFACFVYFVCFVVCVCLRNNVVTCSNKCLCFVNDVQSYNNSKCFGLFSPFLRLGQCQMHTLFSTFTHCTVDVTEVYLRSYSGLP